MGLIFFFVFTVIFILGFVRLGQIRDTLDAQQEHNKELLEEMKELRQQLKEK